MMVLKIFNSIRDNHIHCPSGNIVFKEKSCTTENTNYTQIT